MPLVYAAIRLAGAGVQATGFRPLDMAITVHPVSTPSPPTTDTTANLCLESSGLDVLPFGGIKTAPKTSACSCKLRHLHTLVPEATVAGCRVYVIIKEDKPMPRLSVAVRSLDGQSSADGTRSTFPLYITDQQGTSLIPNFGNLSATASQIYISAAQGVVRVPLASSTVPCMYVHCLAEILQMRSWRWGSAVLVPPSRRCTRMGRGVQGKLSGAVGSPKQVTKTEVFTHPYTIHTSFLT